MIQGTTNRTVAAIVLAAGESRRMGGTNKLALDIGGEALLHRTVRTLQASTLSDLVVVLGHEADAARSLLDGLDVRTVVNEAYAQGQMTSVHRGLEALTRPCDGVMICLSDQPLLTSGDIDFLIDAFAARPDAAILVPVHRGQRGNPIILASTQREAILAGGRNLGCKHLIDRNPELVTTIEAPSDHFVFDLDTPADYDSLQRQGAGGVF